MRRPADSRHQARRGRKFVAHSPGKIEAPIFLFEPPRFVRQPTRTRATNVALPCDEGQFPPDFTTRCYVAEARAFRCRRWRETGISRATFCHAASALPPRHRSAPRLLSRGSQLFRRVMRSCRRAGRAVGCSRPAACATFPRDAPPPHGVSRGLRHYPPPRLSFISRVLGLRIANEGVLRASAHEAHAYGDSFGAFSFSDFA